MFMLRPSFCSIATVIGVCVFVRARTMSVVLARRRRFFPCRRRRSRRAAVRRQCQGRRRARGTPIRRHLAARCTDRCADRRRAAAVARAQTTRHVPRIRRASKARRPGRGCCVSSRRLCTTTFCGRVFCSRRDVWRPRGPGPPHGYGHAHSQQHHDGAAGKRHQRAIGHPCGPTDSAKYVRPNVLQLEQIIELVLRQACSTRSARRARATGATDAFPVQKEPTHTRCYMPFNLPPSRLGKH